MPPDIRLRARSTKIATKATSPKSTGCSNRAKSANTTKLDSMAAPVPAIDHSELVKILALTLIGPLQA